jgi:hypothetical protein
MRRRWDAEEGRWTSAGTNGTPSIARDRRVAGSDQGIRSRNGRREVPAIEAGRAARLGEGSTQAWPPAERCRRQGHFRQRRARPSRALRRARQGSRHQSGLPDRARPEGSLENGGRAQGCLLLSQPPISSGVDQGTRPGVTGCVVGLDDADHRCAPRDEHGEIWFSRPAVRAMASPSGASGRLMVRGSFHLRASGVSRSGVADLREAGPSRKRSAAGELGPTPSRWLERGLWAAAFARGRRDLSLETTEW